jgi:tetratricopeptide (TPR) repeat protein
MSVSQPQNGALQSSRAKYALVPTTGTFNPLAQQQQHVQNQQQQSSAAAVVPSPRGGRRSHNTNTSSARGGGHASSSASTSGALVLPAMAADASSAAPLLSPRHLRDIGKFVDSNIRLPHAHRTGGGGAGQLVHIIPQCPFVQAPAVGDALLKLAIAPIHAKESALDVPLRLTCPEQYHCPLLMDPRSNGTIASRIVSLLKGANSLPVHWEGDTQGAEKSVAKINAIRDSEMRAAAANRSQKFDKEARALLSCGAMLYNSGNLEKAVQSFNTAVQRFEVVGDAQGVAFAHNVLGVCYYRLKEFKMALVHHKKQQVLSASYGKAVAQINLGVAYSALGENSFAEQAFADAHHSALEAQDSVLETIALGNLGLTYMRLGDVRKSQTNLEQCLEHCSIAGDRVGSAVCLLLLGEIYSVVDDAEHALFYYEHAFRVAGEAAVSDLQEIARVSIGVTRGNQNAKASMSTFAKALGQNVGMAELLLSLPHQ